MKNLLSKLFSLKVLPACTFIVGILVGVVCYMYFSSPYNNKDCIEDYKFIRPTINCDVSDSKLEKLSFLQEKMDLFVNSKIKTGSAKRISVFVRDLNTSRFAGVNDSDIFYMASLLKTPLLIGGYKLAEVEPRILDQKITYTGKPDLYEEQVVLPDEVLKVGNEYSIKDLMERSVKYSDNTSAQLLFDYYPTDFMDRIMQALGIQITRQDGVIENTITARSYAGVFRILYNASYLTNEYSNESLRILSETTFKDAATSKLPKDIKVAHKFSERTTIDTATGKVLTKQFHECGIVYDKKDPYIFCIMTEGNDYEKLKEVIGDISKLIYDEMID